MRSPAVHRLLEPLNALPRHRLALNCIECNVFCDLLIAMGEQGTADALLEAHVAGDEEGDDPEHLRIKTKTIRNDSF